MIDIEDAYVKAMDARIEIAGLEYSALTLLANWDLERFEELVGAYAEEQVNKGYWVRISNTEYVERFDEDLGYEPLDFSGATEGDR
jgi:hypothetical protein